MLSNQLAAAQEQQKYNLLMQAQPKAYNPLYGFGFLGSANAVRKNVGNLDYDFYNYIESCKTKLERDYAP